jgi:YHS domain-containing protein
MLRIGFLVVCVFALGVRFGEHISAAEKKQVEKQRFCPVFTDRIVGSESRFLRYQGIKVFFSSDLAARKWMRDPESYLDKTLLPQLGDLTLPPRLTPQHYCPVRTKWKISMRDPTLIYQGQRVFLFDEESLRTWNSAPEKFLDPKILPQFAEEETPAEEEDEEPSP